MATPIDAHEKLRASQPFVDATERLGRMTISR